MKPIIQTKIYNLFTSCIVAITWLINSILNFIAFEINFKFSSFYPQMLPKDFDIYKNKMIKCIKYKDYETAIYISLYLSSFNSDFVLLSGILLYENKEYSRSLQILGESNSVSRLYYTALNYKAKRQFKEAISSLSLIIDGSSINEVISDDFVKNYNLSADDGEFYDLMMGELMILKGKCYPGIEKYKRSFSKDPLLGACYGLYDENIYINVISEDPIAKLYQNLFKMNLQQQNNTIEQIPKDTAELIKHFPDIKEYYENTPGYGSYFLSRLASSFSRFTSSKIGNEIFEYLRKHDLHFIRELDVYSTALWVAKDFNLLGLLAKDLISSSPNHHISWAVLGNYYSVAGLPKESYTCLMKSLSILETHNAYTLLGFECNAKSQYLEAQGYFRSSLCMLENNDRAYFGMGISFSELSKKNSAETYFNKALALNPRNINMQALVVRFYVKNKSDEISLQKIREFLRIDFESYNEIVKHIQSRMGTFKEMEELIILEFCELLVRIGRRDLAKNVLSCVNCRTKTYFAKRNIIENGE